MELETGGRRIWNTTTLASPQAALDSPLRDAVGQALELLDSSYAPSPLTVEKAVLALRAALDSGQQRAPYDDIVALCCEGLRDWEEEGRPAMESLGGPDVPELRRERIVRTILGIATVNRRDDLLAVLLASSAPPPVERVLIDTIAALRLRIAEAANGLDAWLDMTAAEAAGTVISVRDNLWTALDLGRGLRPSSPATAPQAPEPKEGKGMNYSTEYVTSLHGHPLWEAIWATIKPWDIQREPGQGYAGATGDDATRIYEAVQSVR